MELVIAGSEIWFSFFDTNSRQDNLSIRIFRISCHFLFDSFYLCQIKLIYHCKISYLLCHWVQDGLNSFCVKHGHCYFYFGTILYLREIVSIAYKLPQIQSYVQQQRLQVDKHLISRITATTYYR